jgi:hypothetical protein
MTTAMQQQQQRGVRVVNPSETIVVGDIVVTQTRSSEHAGMVHREDGSKLSCRELKMSSIFINTIDLARAARVGMQRIGYWQIAQAGSYKGCIRASFDSPPSRRYGAQSRGVEIIDLILETRVSCEKNYPSAGYLLASGETSFCTLTQDFTCVRP